MILKLLGTDWDESNWEIWRTSTRQRKPDCQEALRLRRGCAAERLRRLFFLHSKSKVMWMYLLSTKHKTPNIENPSRWSHRDSFNNESQHRKHICPPKCERLSQCLVKAQNQQQGAVNRAFTSGGSGQSTMLFFGPGRQLAPCLAHYRRCCFNSVRKKNLTRQQAN